MIEKEILTLHPSYYRQARQIARDNVDAIVRDVMNNSPTFQKAGGVYEQFTKAACKEIEDKRMDKEKNEIDKKAKEIAAMPQPQLEERIHNLLVIRSKLHHHVADLLEDNRAFRKLDSFYAGLYRDGVNPERVCCCGHLVRNHVDDRLRCLIADCGCHFFTRPNEIQPGDVYEYDNTGMVHHKECGVTKPHMVVGSRCETRAGIFIPGWPKTRTDWEEQQAMSKPDAVERDLAHRLDRIEARQDGAREGRNNLAAQYNRLADLIEKNNLDAVERSLRLDERCDKAEDRLKTREIVANELNRDIHRDYDRIQKLHGSMVKNYNRIDHHEKDLKVQLEINRRHGDLLIKDGDRISSLEQRPIPNAEAYITLKSHTKEIRNIRNKVDDLAGASHAPVDFSTECEQIDLNKERLGSVNKGLVQLDSALSDLRLRVSDIEKAKPIIAGDTMVFCVCGHSGGDHGEKNSYCGSCDCPTFRWIRATPDLTLGGTHGCHLTPGCRLHKGHPDDCWTGGGGEK